MTVFCISKHLCLALGRCHLFVKGLWHYQTCPGIAFIAVAFWLHYYLLYVSNIMCKYQFITSWVEHYLVSNASSIKNYPFLLWWFEINKQLILLSAYNYIPSHIIPPHSQRSSSFCWLLLRDSFHWEHLSMLWAVIKLQQEADTQEVIEGNSAKAEFMPQTEGPGSL
jgi:hypothetical protein